MDQATLVNLDVHAGARVLSAMDAADLKVSIALWLLSDEHESWRLVFSSPSFDEIGRVKAYERIAVAIRNLDPFVFPLMYVLPMKDPFIKELRKMFSRSANVEGMRLGGQTIGGLFIESAYVYRIQ